MGDVTRLLVVKCCQRVAHDIAQKQVPVLAQEVDWKEARLSSVN